MKKKCKTRSTDEFTAYNINIKNYCLRHTSDTAVSIFQNNSSTPTVLAEDFNEYKTQIKVRF